MRHYGLIGYPLQHSFSKQFFSIKFATENIRADYEAFELTSIEEFPLLIKRHSLSGLNVTAPYKQQIIPYLHHLSETAAAVGAVNVISFKKESDRLLLTGHNSDVIGFERSLLPHLKSRHSKALILGSGGAAQAVFYVLQKLGIETRFVSRNPSGRETIGYNMIDATMLDACKLIVNASPVGTFPNSNNCPQLPYELLSPDHLLYDLVYNPAETLFLKKGKQQGAQTVNGMEMLIGQAEAAWEIWNT